MELNAVLILGAIASGYMAWTIGANDVANAMGTSVGSRSLTIRQALIIAAVANLMGAVLVGGHVTKTIQSGLIAEGVTLSPWVGVRHARKPLRGGHRVTVATYLKLPCRLPRDCGRRRWGAHLIGGFETALSKLTEVAASWVISPTLAGLLAYAVFSLVRARIIQRPDPVRATRAWGPFIIASVFAVLALVILYKGLGDLNLDLDAGAAAILAAVMAALAGLMGWVLIRREPALRVDARTLQRAMRDRDRAQVARGLAVAYSGLEQAAAASETGLREDIEEISTRISELRGAVEPVVDTRRHEPKYFLVEKVFASIQVISATCVAFSQGANDVANAIGLHSIREQLTGTDSLPLWVLLMGSAHRNLSRPGMASHSDGWHGDLAHPDTRLRRSSRARRQLFASRLGFRSQPLIAAGAVLVSAWRGGSVAERRVARSIVVSWLSHCRWRGPRYRADGLFRSIWVAGCGLRRAREPAAREI